MGEMQVRLPVFVHQSRDESARDFVERCQQDSSVFTAAVTTLADLIDMPKAEALAVLRFVVSSFRLQQSSVCHHLV